MNPESAREILLIRSLEASDRDGIAFQPKARVQATKDAGIEPRTAEDARLSPAEETRLIGRSRSMVRNLENQSGDALRLVALAGAERGRLPLFVMSVLLGAFVLGAVSNYLGRDGVINLLAIPIFGLIAWNVVMYLIMAVSPLISRRQRGGLLTERVGEWLKKGMMTKAAVLDEPYRVSAQKFVGDWTELSAPARWRRIRMLAHACAILLAAGVLAGMYLRGIGYEYKAGWESTFLDAEGVRNWLRFLLGPGSALTGISIPPGEMTIGQLDLAKGSGEKADQWIHLFAANTALYIFVPRLLFVAWEYVGLGRWRSELGKAPLFAIYYDKLAKGVSGGDQLVHVLPFHCSPEPRQRDTIRSLIHQMWGGAAHVDFSEPAAYGERRKCWQV